MTAVNRGSVMAATAADPGRIIGVQADKHLESRDNRDVASNRVSIAPITAASSHAGMMIAIGAGGDAGAK